MLPKNSTIHNQGMNKPIEDPARFPFSNDTDLQRLNGTRSTIKIIEHHSVKIFLREMDSQNNHV